MIIILGDSWCLCALVAKKYLTKLNNMSGSVIKTKNAVIICILLAFPDNIKASPKVFNILDYKAKGDGVTLNTKSIQAAIDACSKSGGGTVLFPAGRFVSGTIYLKSHVTLLLKPVLFLREVKT